MKTKILFIISLLIIITLICGCSTWNKFDNEEKGAVIGGGSGALIGDAIAPGVGGTLIGGGLGTVAGAAIGSDVKKDRRHHHD